MSEKAPPHDTRNFTVTLGGNGLVTGFQPSDYWEKTKRCGTCKFWRHTETVVPVSGEAFRRGSCDVPKPICVSLNPGSYSLDERFGHGCPTWQGVA